MNNGSKRDRSYGLLRCAEECGAGERKGQRSVNV
jgi:hypothetical protein